MLANEAPYCNFSQQSRALDAPDQYRHLIVRVGGYSARFVDLDRSLQEDIINRMRHSR